MKRILLVLTAIFQTFGAELQCPNFDLPDQFGKTHHVTFPNDRPVLITIADHKGAAAMDMWVTALKNHYGTNVTYIGIADVRGTPAPMRPFVKSQFKKKYPRPVLLDWEGKISGQLLPKPKVPNIYYFTREGHLAVHKKGAYSETAFADVPRVRGRPAESN